MFFFPLLNSISSKKYIEFRTKTKQDRRKHEKVEMFSEVSLFDNVDDVDYVNYVNFH